MKILIPFKENSDRAPYKNLFLLPFTLEYLKQENIDLQAVYTYGFLSELTKKVLDKVAENLTGSPLKHIQVDEKSAGNHKRATEYALNALDLGENEAVIMLQLTNPKREHGLIQRAVEAVKTEPALSVISAVHILSRGRVLSPKGSLTDKGDFYLYDGAIYAGTKKTLLQVFDMSLPHNTTENGFYSVADIDYPKDILNAFNTK